MWEVWIEIHLCPEVMYGFHCADFKETHQHSINFFGCLMYQTSSKLDEKYRKYGNTFIYAHKAWPPLHKFSDV
jgi:hypothetical protein